MDFNKLDETRQENLRRFVTNFIRDIVSQFTGEAQYTPGTEILNTIDKFPKAVELLGDTVDTLQADMRNVYLYLMKGDEVLKEGWFEDLGRAYFKATDTRRDVNVPMIWMLAKPEATHAVIKRMGEPIFVFRREGNIVRITDMKNQSPPRAIDIRSYEEVPLPNEV